jgi:hypothetical protein
MSQEGMERIRLAIEAFNRRDVDAMLRWNDPDVVHQTAIASMEHGKQHPLAKYRSAAPAKASSTPWSPAAWSVSTTSSSAS